MVELYLPPAPHTRDGLDYCYSCPNSSCMSLGGLHWNPSKGLGICWVCKKGYNVVSLKKVFGGTSVFQLPELTRRERPKISREYLSWSDSNLCRNLLLDPDLKVGWGLNEKTMQHQLSAPVFDPKSNRIGFKVGGQRATFYNWRSIFRERRGWKLDFGVDRDTAHYTSPDVGGVQDTVFLVEGILDCLRLQSAGVSAISSLGTSPGKSLPEMFKQEGVNRIIVWYDPDRAGVRGEEKVRELFSPIFFLVQVFRHDREPGDMTSQEIVEMFKLPAFDGIRIGQ